MTRPYLIACSLLMVCVSALVLGTTRAAATLPDAARWASPPCWHAARKPVAERDLARPHEQVQVVDLHTHRSAPPETLAAMVADAEAVVVATITRQDFRIEPCGGLAVTLATATVRMVIKDHPLLAGSPGRIVIYRLGGVWREPAIDGTTRIVREVEEGYPPFTTGAEYVLFLNTSAWGYRWPAEVWRPAFAEHGTVGVAVDGRTLRPLAPDGAVGRAAGTASLGEFTAELRALVSSDISGTPAATAVPVPP